MRARLRTKKTIDDLEGPKLDMVEGTRSKTMRPRGGCSIQTMAAIPKTKKTADDLKGPRMSMIEGIGAETGRKT